MRRFFIVKYEDIIQSGFCEERLKVHELTNQLATEGWIDIKYPESTLRKDFKILKQANLEHYLKFMDRIYQYSRPYGYKLLAHFNPIGDMRSKKYPTFREAWNKRCIYKSINRIIEFKRDITRISIMNVLSKYDDGHTRAGYKFPNITLWRAIFRKMKVQSIIDLASHMGEKAIAAAADNIAYTTYDNSHVDLQTFLNVKNNDPEISVLSTICPLSNDILTQRINEMPTNVALAVLTSEQLQMVDVLEKYQLCYKYNNDIPVLYVVKFCPK